MRKATLLKPVLLLLALLLFTISESCKKHDSQPPVTETPDPLPATFIDTSVIYINTKQQVYDSNKQQWVYYEKNDTLYKTDTLLVTRLDEGHLRLYGSLLPAFYINADDYDLTINSTGHYEIGAYGATADFSPYYKSVACHFSYMSGGAYLRTIEEIFFNGKRQ